MLFYMFSTIHAYLSLLFSNFVFLFSPSFSYTSRHETHSTIYDVWFHCGILISELRVMSYESISLWVAFIARVTSYFYCTSYELLFAYELRVTVYCTSYELLFAYELRVNLYMWVTSYFLTMSYNEDKDDKAVYDNKVMIKNYSLRSLFDKELGAR